jgi:methylmalonyl-CoA mutase
MTTRRDPWGNLLRGTLACFGAGLGGADAVTVLPFDVAIGRPDAFSRRIARNTHALLMEESHLSRVIDPAGGSWYVEQLTREVARQAWAIFQRIEAGGGIAAGLADGSIAAELAATAAQRRSDLAHRRRAITGVTEFALLDERDVVREPWAEDESGGLPRTRYAADYEALRDRSDAILAAAGARPTVSLVPLGSGPEVTSRTAFAAGALQPGGIVVDEGGPDADVRAVCLCAGDDVDAGRLAATITSLHDRGTTVLAVGAPPDAPGIDVHLNPGADLVAALTAVLDSLEVPS